MSLKSFLLLLGILVIFSFVLGTSRPRTSDYFRDIFLFSSQGEKLGQDIRISRFRGILTAFSILVISLFLSLFIGQSDLIGQSDGENARDFLLYGNWQPCRLRTLPGWCLLKSLISLLLYFAVKSLFIWLYSRIHFPRKLSFVGNRQYVTHLRLVAIPMIPVLGINEIFVLSGIALSILFVVFWLLAECRRVVKLYHFFSSEGVSLFQFLLYLCALEILPIFVFCKAVFEWS